MNFLFVALEDPEETRVLPKFATRLLASTQLSEVDPECVPYLGFLPQDMLGRSILEFYHPEDMPSMKDVYAAGELFQNVCFCLFAPINFSVPCNIKQILYSYKGAGSTIHE